MSIANLTDRELTALEKNYLSKGVVTGGPFSLAEVRLEKLRRLPRHYDSAFVARKIVELARSSDDGLTSYIDLWQSLEPDKPWAGPATLQALSGALRRVIGYCVSHNLPIVTVLVVRANNRALTADAIMNVFQEALDLGVDAGSDPNSFVSAQLAAARNLVEFPQEGAV